MKSISYEQSVTKHKVLALIGAILAIAIGVCCVIAPFAAGAILIWVIIGLIGVFGIFSIIKFIVPGKGNSRNGWMLAAGIILLLCSVAIILAGIFAKDVVFEGNTYTGLEATTVRLLAFGSIFFGVLAIFSNIFLLCSVGSVPHEEKGWVIAKGVIGIIVGVAMTIFPFFMFFVSVIIGGVYLIVMGITLIVLDCKMWNAGKKDKKPVEEAKEVKEEK